MSEEQQDKRGIMQYLNVQNGRYSSPAGQVSLLSRYFPSLIFYPRFLAVVVNASGKAKAGKYPDDVWAEDSLRVLRLLETAGLRVSVEGLENLETMQGPVVFIANHMSIMETLVLPVIILQYARVTYVVKESLLTYPVFKHVMLSRNPVAVTRTHPRQDLKTVMTAGSDRLKDGISVIVFPQTTRSTGFDPAHFGSIGVKLAKKAGVPIIPLALKTDAWQNGKYSKDFGRLLPGIPVRFAFGSPLQVEGKGGEEHQQVADFIDTKLQQWQ